MFKKLFSPAIRTLTITKTVVKPMYLAKPKISQVLSVSDVSVGDYILRKTYTVPYNNMKGAMPNGITKVLSIDSKAKLLYTKTTNGTTIKIFLSELDSHGCNTRGSESMECYYQDSYYKLTPIDQVYYE
ncbi:hypothetical protein Molly5_4 [Maribacter phage Molly_5]|uniref:Uncharacterized protein n=1 Tax=Maribacter phage Molly_1 TaxID=2745685 RepID=A0A8E4UYC7_9CAUD|nr:hypothetical protein M1M29_gp004 [Maribacter phage Molly_1]QQO97722.1 hypothetical protein Molly2_4 [Maribacter phage Molly_2]QQO97922.1 hypothetical protein Molly3_4 [Maribacter phage Molly_3]QQO98122.1 hypothetical protein Molly4_4 [Maribacter phage Molly_4]QQO98322.1 hypothetical protein Molly5_4 [Maribacter phage Molly_5]QQO97522.1 hypothetical protein Molly1_4 [Maribacter phage Molly_1]